jgi:hypothetical protein
MCNGRTSVTTVVSALNVKKLPAPARASGALAISAEVTKPVKAKVDFSMRM